MTEFAKFRRSLAVHPGVPVVSILTVFGAISGLNNHNNAGHEWQYMAFGALAMSLFWIPVLVTAWQMRECNGTK